MSVTVHSMSVLDGSNPDFTDRVLIGMKTGIVNAVGSGAGASVTTAVAFAEGLPPTYVVVVQANQDAVGFAAAKTQAGFNVTLNPRLAANTLAAGTFDVLIFG